MNSLHSPGIRAAPLLLAFVLLSFGFVPCALAPVGATLTGVVKDHSGAVVKGASVKVTNTCNGQSQVGIALEVMVVDAKDHATKAGSEVCLYKAGTRTVLGGRLVDTGSGYNSQSVLPVHFGLGKETGLIDVEVTWMSPTGRKKSSGWQA